jgi:hypothetical protein
MTGAASLKLGENGEGFMRDIRSDLQERATLVDEQIRAAVLTLRRPFNNSKQSGMRG